MTEKKYIVALDQGTTSSRAVVMDHDANIISVSQREFEQIYPEKNQQPGTEDFSNALAFQG